MVASYLLSCLNTPVAYLLTFALVGFLHFPFAQRRLFVAVGPVRPNSKLFGFILTVLGVTCWIWLCSLYDLKGTFLWVAERETKRTTQTILGVP